MDCTLFAAIHGLALIYANAFTERYGFGYADADAEIWGLGYAAIWKL